MRRMNAQAKQVYAIFTDMLNHAAGDLTPQLDDVASVLRKTTGGRHSEALARVTSSLNIVLGALEADDWFWVKVTDYYVEKYRGLPGEEAHPASDVELIRCVAGGGKASVTAAIHFCPTEDCNLVMQRTCMNLTSGERKTAKSAARLLNMAEARRVTGDFIERSVALTGTADRRDIQQAIEKAS